MITDHASIRIAAIDAELNAYRQGWLGYSAEHVAALRRERAALTETPYTKMSPHVIDALSHGRPLSAICDATGKRYCAPVTINYRD
jgi:hypothetical protein